ncbi:MAG: NAD(P)H-dependent oxidoreductase [Oscillospiraceae bacterium]|nr:NAD(P)H-dependent oxidoreductase [Oscillospiraceae bacterium]
MKKFISVLLCMLLGLTMVSCGVSENSGEDFTSEDTRKENSDTTAAVSSVSETENITDNSEASKILVAYFSLADEQYEVGIIEKGNTEIIAEIIADKTGAELFKINANTDYPTTYEGLLDISKQEESDPPELAKNVTNMADYDIVFIGYPIWWGDLPTIVKVFLESNDFSNKTVIPFCTHAGSGLSGTQKSVENLCNGAEIRDGLAVRGTTAQNDRDEAEKAVTDWLSELGIS